MSVRSAVRSALLPLFALSTVFVLCAPVNAQKGPQATAKTKLETFVVHSDGVNPLNGTVVKSKSNISNN